MSGSNRTDFRHCAVAMTLGVSLAAALPAGQAAAAEWDFTPRIRATQHWTDNVTAAPSGFEESEWITAVTPGFTLGLEGPRGQMDLSYEAQALWYRDNSEFDDVYHSLLGNGQLVLVPNRFFVDGFARYDQENIDPTQRLTTGNIFQTGNRTDVGVYGFSPWYTQRFGDWGETLVRYSYQGVRYRDTDDTAVRVQDSDRNSIEGRIGSPRDRPGLSWGASASYQRTDFEFVPEFEYARAALDFGYPVGARTRVTVTGGMESDVLEDRTTGGFDEEFWLVGLAWNPTDLQSLSVQVGRRFFGTSFELDWQRRGTRGDLSVSYREEPTTANNRLLDGEGVFAGGRPGLPALDPEVYLSKRLTASGTYNLTRTRLAASLYGEKRERSIEDQGVDDEVYGVRLSADWDAAPRTRVNVFTRYERRDFGGTLRTSDYYQLGAGVRRDLTRTLFASFDIAHLRRDFDARDDYRINTASISIGAEF